MSKDWEITWSIKSLNDSVKGLDSGVGEHYTHSQWKLMAPLHSSLMVRSGEDGHRQTRQTGQNTFLRVASGRWGRKQGPPEDEELHRSCLTEETLEV